MIRRAFYLSEEQNNLLKGIGSLSVSEHLRRAIDEYIEKIKAKNVSASQSTRKEAENG